MQPLKLSIDGMSCDHCVRAVQKALEAIPGVQVQEVAVGSATLQLSSLEILSRVKAAVEEEGFSVIDPPAE